MTDTKEKLTSEDVISWFGDSENFKHLPTDILDKVVRFFTEQPTTSVDPCQIIEFLEFGRNFTVYYDYDEFMSALDLSRTKAILACKANFDCFDDVVVWFESFSPKLIKSIPPSEERIQKVRQNYGAENNKHDQNVQLWRDRFIHSDGN